MKLPVLALAAALSLAAGCAGPSPSPSPTPLPGSPDIEPIPGPLHYLLPNGSRVPGYEPVNPHAYDPRFLSSDLGVAPARFEDLPYLTADRLQFVHVQVADFNTSAEAREAYANYTAAFPAELCPNRSTLDFGDENILCDNAGHFGSYLTAVKGRSLLLAFTHDGNRTPFGDMMAFARRTAGRVGGSG